MISQIKKHRLLVLLLALCLICINESKLYAQSGGVLFTVNEVGDTVDVNQGDGLCADITGKCTLRAAIGEANTTPARDAIIFNLPQPSVINLTLGELAINNGLDIVGPGARRLTIQRSAVTGTPDFRIFHIGSALGVNLRNMTIRNGNADEGGALLSELHSITGIYDSAVTANRAVNGGAFAVRQARLTILRSLVNSNIADSKGGGLYNIGDPSDGTTITSSTFTDNSALTGGAIRNEGPLLLVNDTIGSNKLLSRFRKDFDRATNRSISRISVDASSIFSGEQGSVSVLNTIIGRDINGSSTTLSGNFISLGHNIITNALNSTGFTNGVNSDQVSDNNLIDPKLGVLANNGGQTDTMAVLQDSPALDSGDPCVINGVCSQLPGIRLRGSTDQRGYRRFISLGSAAGPEIGAYEQTTFTSTGNGTFGIFSSNTSYPPDTYIAVLTNVRTLEKRRTIVSPTGSVTFSNINISDNYVMEIRATHLAINVGVSVVAFD